MTPTVITEIKGTEDEARIIAKPKQLPMHTLHGVIQRISFTHISIYLSISDSPVTSRELLPRGWPRQTSLALLALPLTALHPLSPTLSLPR